MKTVHQRLLTRDEFRHGVFARDSYRCAICGTEGIGDIDHACYTLDAHHILERRLWTVPDEFGGYFLDNGITLCETHHRAAERTTLGCAEIRAACGITVRLLPEHLQDDGSSDYDKWGNSILSGGQRLKGELFLR